MTIVTDESFPFYHHGDGALSRQRKREYDNTRRAKEYARRFIAWDGEGVTINGEHHYILFGNSLGEFITGTPEAPLTYRDCFPMLLDAKRRFPRAVHVVYGGNYDTNMMLKPLSRRRAEYVYRNEWATVGKYRVSWRSSKSLTVHYDRQTVTLYDVISFFQTSFVRACDDYLGDDWPNADLVRQTKLLRSVFRQEDMAEIQRYCAAELDALVLLMGELRERLDKVGLRIRRWDGPGAIAASLLRREGVKHHKDVFPDGPDLASRYAYAGGRFELVRCGHVEEPVYEYDINSAYPYAMTHLPSLTDGRWEHVEGDPGYYPFALYHVSLSAGYTFRPTPLFRRGIQGDICYPDYVTGWYWTPEYALLDGYDRQILEAWVFHPASDHRPFAFIPDLYEQRRELKAAGDGAHVGIKLGLNSLYGKLAQQLGWKDNPLRLPPFHQLGWAGFVTSFCRAQLFAAAANTLDDVIAFETDAVFSTVPLPVDCGDGLGQWKETVLDSLTYLQSGFYFATVGGQEVVRQRGFDRGSVRREQVLEALRSGRYDMEAKQTRFVTLGSALQGGWSRWCRWETEPRKLTLSPIGKRVHVVCPECDDESELRLGVWHRTICPHGFTPMHSQPFPVEWIDGPHESDRRKRWD